MDVQDSACTAFQANQLNNAEDMHWTLCEILGIKGPNMGVFLFFSVSPFNTATKEHSHPHAPISPGGRVEGCEAAASVELTL